MERLTGRKENGHAYIIGCPDFEIPKIIGMIIQRVVDKCADIEDILGDEYDLDRLRKIVSIIKAIPHTCNYCIGCEVEPKDGHGCDEYDSFVLSTRRLLELVQSDRDGRCAPLKPGDIVMCIWYGRPTQNKVERINFYWVDDGIDWYAITTSTTGSKECFGKEEWGKTVFPTYEAAEAALKGK